MKELCDILVNLSLNETNFKPILNKRGFEELFHLVRSRVHREDGVTILLRLAHCNKQVRKFRGIFSYGAKLCAPRKKRHRLWAFTNILIKW